MTADVAEADVERPEIGAVADNIAALMRSFIRARSRIVAHAEHDVEWSAYMLLKNVAGSHEPMRASALAECVHSDPSTVSRQVAGLVKDGYLERRADPDDGRASLLVLTPKAEILLTEHDQIRRDYFARILDGWSDTDLRRFTALLERFTRAHEAVTTSLTTEGIAERSARAGSKH